MSGERLSGGGRQAGVGIADDVAADWEVVHAISSRWVFLVLLYVVRWGWQMESTECAWITALRREKGLLLWTTRRCTFSTSILPFSNPLALFLAKVYILATL